MLIDVGISEDGEDEERINEAAEVPDAMEFQFTEELEDMYGM
jgi:hypothetical protein